jgi:site-specific DNA recombinase
MSVIKKLQCAVYTRKSSEEGLDQTFNSLDAQREACEAYIASQASLGWRLVPEHYDDGGISGGTLERPGIQRLLHQIREGRIDVIVVYKIDRLTRSLIDFAKLVEIFDGHAVSFVSVTQQFNTTTSMGRLTLNVLLSFAQFEREVTAERIRDKVAASKKKGMWMGGVVPYGYRAQDRKLVIDDKSAAAVQGIFDRYLVLRSVPALVLELNEERVRENVDPNGLGAPKVPRYPHSRGKIYHLLSNPVYVGKIRHKGELHDGEHAPIIEPDLFEAVQQLLAAQAASRKGATMHDSPHLLTGRIFDEHGNRLTPVHTQNHGKRYRYYVTDSRLARAKGADVWRVAASTIEAAVEAQLLQLLNNHPQLATWTQEYSLGVNLPHLLENASILRQRVIASDAGNFASSIIKVVIKRVTLASDRIRYDVDARQLLSIISNDTQRNHRGGGERSTITDQEVFAEAKLDGPTSLVTLERPIAIKRRGVEMKIVLDDPETAYRAPDQTLVEGIANAHYALRMLTDGSAQSIASVADAMKMDASDISRILPLAFLSPKLTEAILTGRHSPDLTLRRLTRGTDLPILWSDQDALLSA